jgi:hypothetical protein
MASSSRNVASLDEFNLDKLIQFNPALIYLLRPETSSRPATAADALNPNYLLITAGQYQDLFEAYIYAQENILPVMKAKGIATITAKKLLEWLNQIHLRAAKTLALDVETPTFAGSYTIEQAFISEPYIPLILKDLFQSNAPITKNNLAAAVQRHSHEIESEEDYKHISELYNSGAMQDMIDILKGVVADKTIQASHEDYSDGFVSALNKLGDKYSQKGFSSEQENLIHEFFSLGVEPSKIPSHMESVAEKILMAWKKCNAKNSDEVAQLLAVEFSLILKCHPYFNVNARIATCLINITLCSLELPTIVLRTEDQTNALNIAYTTATKNISSQPELFLAHIKKCMALAPVKPSYDKVIISGRVAAAKWTRKIMSEFPKFNIEKFFKVDLSDIMNKAPNSVQKLTSSDLIGLNTIMKQANLPELKALEISQDIFPKLYAALAIHRIVDSLAAQYRILCPSSLNDAVTTQKYSNAEKDSILCKLIELTMQDNWKLYKTPGLTILLECKHELAMKIADALNETSTLHAEVKVKTGSSPKVYVVKIDSVNTAELLKITSLKGFEPKLTRNPKLVRKPV